MTELELILSKLPYQNPFLFVEGIDFVNENEIQGYYTFKQDEYFYKGHFKDNPITPGVILLETMAQIGLVCHALYLSKSKSELTLKLMAFSSAEIQFLKPIYPGERVVVKAELIYFRLGKIKSKVLLYNAKGELACQGSLSGIAKV